MQCRYNINSQWKTRQTTDPTEKENLNNAFELGIHSNKTNLSDSTRYGLSTKAQITKLSRGQQYSVYRSIKEVVYQWWQYSGHHASHLSELLVVPYHAA